MEKKENASKLISSLVALSLATTLGVPTIALADATGSDEGSATAGTQQQVAEGETDAAPLEANETPTAQQSENASTLPTAENGVITITKSGTYSISEDTIASIVVTKDVTANLDLGGKTLKSNAQALDIYGNLTLSNGNVCVENSDAESTIAAIWVNGSAHLTIEKNATVNTTGKSFCIGYWKDCTSAEVTVKGTVKGDNGITMNGNISAEGTSNKLTLDGATVQANGHAIYQAGGAATSFTLNNSNITGGSTGIEVRAGNLTVNNCTITGGNSFHVSANNNGTTTDGAGIAIAQHTTKQPINVVVNGGSVSGAYAIYESNPQSNSADDISKVKLSVTGGTFTGGVYSQDVTGFITGGTFSDPGVYQYAESGTVNVKLADDYTGDIVVPAEVTSTLNLNGHKITNISSDTIFNKGTLTVDGAGTIDNVTHGKAAIYNIGTATLKSGTFDRSKEAGTDNSNNTGNNGGNSYYTILNHGTMTVENAVTVNNKGGFSSLFSNGYCSWKTKDGVAAPTLIINGGSYSGGLNTIKNDDDAILTINGGTFKNYTQAAFQNHGTATVTNGDFSATSKYAIDNCGCEETHDPGKLTITDGHFTGILNIRSQYSDVAISGGKFDGTISKTAGSLNITGGTFSSEPDASYIADGYEAVKSGANWVVQVPYTPAPAPTTETTTTTNPDGTTTTTVTDKKTGESTSTTEGANGTTVVKRTDASGNTTTEVTVPEGAATNAGAPVEIPAAAEVAKGEQVSVSAPTGTVVGLPIASAGAGDVAVIVHADGTETVIPMSLVEGGKAIVKLDGNETVKIIDNAKDFSDVPAEHWAADDIDFASSHEIFKGIGNGDTYEPETALTRNMMMTVLARTAGADTEGGDPWYAKGQQWAVDNGVSNGLWGEDNITREQLVTMLFNYANKAGLDTSARADISGMENADAVSSWATEAVQWAVAEGILKGVDNIDLAPQGLATRAQAAAFMQRYVKAALL